MRKETGDGCGKFLNHRKHPSLALPSPRPPYSTSWKIGLEGHPDCRRCTRGIEDELNDVLRDSHFAPSLWIL